MHPTKDFAQIGDVSLRRRFESDLTLAALIIAQLKIRGAGDHALDGFVSQWKCSGIATNDHWRSPLAAPECWKHRAFIPPLRAGRRRTKIPAPDFVTWRDVFSRHGAKCAPQSLGLRGRIRFEG